MTGPRPPRGLDRFLDLEMPEYFRLDFQTDRRTWMDWGAYDAGDFERLEDGAYVCQVHGFSPTWIRCVARHPDHIEHVDGSGQVHRYRLVELPDPAARA